MKRNLYLIFAIIFAMVALFSAVAPYSESFLGSRRDVPAALIVSLFSSILFILSFSMYVSQDRLRIHAFVTLVIAMLALIGLIAIVGYILTMIAFIGFA